MGLLDDGLNFDHFNWDLFHNHNFNWDLFHNHNFNWNLFHNHNFNWNLFDNCSHFNLVFRIACQNCTFLLHFQFNWDLVDDWNLHDDWHLDDDELRDDDLDWNLLNNNGFNSDLPDDFHWYLVDYRHLSLS